MNLGVRECCLNLLFNISYQQYTTDKLHHNITQQHDEAVHPSWATFVGSKAPNGHVISLLSCLKWLYRQNYT